MKKYLLPKDGHCYKANLHMHTTVSDGNMTPEQTKDEYLKHGYSIVNFSDHEVPMSHADLCDERFLALTSCEISLEYPSFDKNNNVIEVPFAEKRVCHMNLISPVSEPTLYPYFCKDALVVDRSAKYITEKMMEANVPLSYASPERLNQIIKECNKKGWLVTLNHPWWSLMYYPDYIDLEGLWGVEWYNTLCRKETFLDTVQPLRDLWSIGKYVNPIAADDAHCIAHCFGGFTMIKAKTLSYNDVFEALKEGNLYSSTGPLIDELYIEDGVIHIKCSKVKRIDVITERRSAKHVENSDGVVESTFDINDLLVANIKYIAINLYGFDGAVARTRAYRHNELI